MWKITNTLIVKTKLITTSFTIVTTAYKTLNMSFPKYIKSTYTTRSIDPITIETLDLY